MDAAWRESNAYLEEQAAADATFKSGLRLVQGVPRRPVVVRSGQRALLPELGAPAGLTPDRGAPRGRLTRQQRRRPATREGGGPFSYDLESEHVEEVAPLQTAIERHGSRAPLGGSVPSNHVVCEVSVASSVVRESCPHEVLLPIVQLCRPQECVDRLLDFTAAVSVASLENPDEFFTRPRHSRTSAHPPQWPDR